MTTAFRPRHRPWRWLALWSVLLVLVAAGSLMPAQNLPTPSVPGLDKLEHLVGHGLLSAYAAMLFAPARLRIAAVVGLFGFGLGIEGAQQAFTTSRMADAGDILANAIGVALGQLVAITPMAGWLAAIDARLHA